MAATAFLATALYRETRAADPIAKYAIYHVLVSQPLSFDELIIQARKQVAQSDGMSFEPKTIQTAVAEMLEKGHLEIKDGLLHLTRP